MDIGILDILGVAYHLLLTAYSPVLPLSLSGLL